MYHYELQTIRQADLVREADAHRLACEALRARKAAAQRGHPEGGGRVGLLSHLFDRARLILRRSARPGENG
jgi:hypothetical protein